MTETITETDLSQIMREVWEDSREKNPETAASEILSRIPEADREEVLLHLLALAYSVFLTGISREPVLTPERMGRMHRRRNPAINPRGFRERVISDLDERPFYVPSRKIRIPFAKMDAACWAEWSQYRRVRMTAYAAAAEWGDLNASKLAEYNVTVSGELPDAVKEELFEQSPEDFSE